MTANIPPTYEDEIDLRAILRTLWKARIIIFLSILIPAFAAFAGSTWLLPHTYQAVAYVFIRTPNVNFTQTTDITIPPTLPDLQVVVQLATAPGLLENVINDPQILGIVEGKKISIVSKATATVLGRDHIRLQVSDTDPELAALLANVWAEKVTSTVNATYSVSAITGSLDDQILQSQKDYEQAQLALEDMLSQSRVDALSAQLLRKQTDLKCVLDANSKVTRVLDDLQTFEQELDGVSGETALSLDDGLALTTLRQESLTSQPCQPEHQPQSSTLTTTNKSGMDTNATNTSVLNISIPNAPDFTLQVDSTSFSNDTVSKALAEATRMRTALQAQLTRLQSKQERLEGEIPQVKRDLENEQAQLRGLTLARDQSHAFYAALLEQQRIGIAHPQSSDVATLSLPAVPPKSAASRNVLVKIIVTAVAALILVVSAVLAIDWWRNNMYGEQKE